jgi:alpha-ketoglutarate-dependent taurine dioxygenase
VTLTTEAAVRAECLQPGSLLPLVIEPAREGVSLVAWTMENRESLRERLLRHGAILLRNFGVHAVEDFAGFTAAASDEVMEYRERSSPRHEVGANIYTSTDYPASQKIFPHNEHSYSQHLPLTLFFCCLKPAERGGETPMADCRRVLRRIAPEVVEKFKRKKWMYVRNFGDGFGLSWQTVFQTADRGEVEAYCARNAIEAEWKEGNRLRTRQVRPAVAAHPRSGEEVWFNHLTFFHVSTLEPMIRDVMLESFAEQDLPNNTYYGDGSPIEPDVLDHLRDAYLQELVSFTWRQGDIVMLDNMLTAHARASYAGPRRVLFAMADPYTRRDI